MCCLVVQCQGLSACLFFVSCVRGCSCMCMGKQLSVCSNDKKLFNSACATKYGYSPATYSLQWSLYRQAVGILPPSSG